jgi:histidinol dehydrogenase
MEREMKIRTAAWAADQRNRTVEGFLARPAFDDRAEDAARSVLGEIRSRGDSAVVAYAKEFDGAELRPRDMRVKPAEITEARKAVDPAFRKAAREARRRIAAFAKAGIKQDWQMPSPKGGVLGEKFVPFDRVGVYVPAGEAPLASTALMTATIAKVAGVPEIVACTPCGADGQVDPYVLYAIDLAGATEIYRVGGIQSIGMMAYGTRTVKQVQKIVGPGGAYVTAAKRQVYGNVALDLVAGPSEIAVLADESAKPSHVAMDLLSQAEHGTGWEKALLVTTSDVMVDAVREALEEHTATLNRADAIRRVAARGGIMLVKVDSVEDGVDLCNRFAPEHLELMVKSPRKWLKKVTCAGAVFLGRWTPESAGDFAAGPSHVLPTGGAAAMFSGLTVDDFRRRSSFIGFTREDLKDVKHVIEAFGRVEGLDAHARSATIRFES